ncbi:cytidine deaminase [uncultured Roseobacter sp.]|uniref:cytidine deaminase n=1 Tax=uncultured Roseobacter sp. TaxID=114847 RepID=UPI00261FAEEC|nr:cytidine deaminase [uncultured Roseobacter sp.]
MSDTASRARDFLEDNPGGVLPANEVAALAGGQHIDDLMREMILVAADYAQPEVSGYKVGAVGLGRSGALILGANFEFAGAPLAQTVHGEQCLVANAIGAGEVGLSRISISAPPCGHCRQFLNELDSAETLEIVIPGRPAVTLESFLPYSFGPRELGVEGGLMKLADHQLVATSALSDLGAAATTAANESYAPYSKAPAGLAVEFADGVRFRGQYLENAAFNPSLPPFQATIAQVIMSGRKASDIVSWASAQLRASPVDHFAFGNKFFSWCAPNARSEAIELTIGEAS